MPVRRGVTRASAILVKWLYRQAPVSVEIVKDQKIAGHAAAVGDPFSLVQLAELTIRERYVLGSQPRLTVILDSIT